MTMKSVRLPNMTSTAFGNITPTFQVPTAVILNQMDKEGTSNKVSNVTFMYSIKKIASLIN